ncbi:hypothetical protein GR160_15375 [Flavobacterium sp. Sd200]|uniref:hypothetical protein n=1 Tax=Flavobacterium sp. Sd200 TaxID=2692211 RepID=UPI001371814D|nr:hypothetical protein [Flavobacterium sp. Sd200]MXN92609.1 hypothetical protein [Flavobacterium sp. Sd200]
MNKDFFAALLKMAGIAAVCLIVNLLVYLVPDLQQQAATFTYPVAIVYLLFFGFSGIILFALHQIAKTSPSQVGYVFLGLTSLKAVGSYFFIKPVLAKTVSFPTEKLNFFVIFMLFLFIEAYFTAILLNKKQ